MTTPSILALADIRRTFMSSGQKISALNGVSISLPRGKTLGIVGESGSGKSTLGRIAVGLDTATSGTVRIDGVDVSTLGAAHRRERFRSCQMIFQDPYSSLNPRMTVGKQIGEGLFASGNSDWKDIRERVADLFEKVGLQPQQAMRFPHEFSGGQRQRIAIARALAPGPSLIVADEPVSALDVTIQAQVLELLAELQSQSFLSYLFISHDMAVMAHLSDQIAVMHKGRIVEFGSTENIIENPQHPYTIRLLEAVPRLDRRRTGDRQVMSPLPEHCDDDRFTIVSPGHEVLLLNR